MTMKNELSRRQFLQMTLGLAGGLSGLVGLEETAEAAERAWELARAAPSPTGMQYRPLGSTGLRVSEIGFGAYPINDPQVLHYAIDRGINYIDTSDDYRGGRSEEVIGQVMRTRRREVILATKFHPWAQTPKKKMLADLEGSLRRLQTDWVDVIQVHRVGRASGGEGVERIENPDLFEAFAAAKQQGKAHFLGVTGHDGDLMEIMDHALRDGRFDVLLCRYNLFDYPEEAALFRRASRQGVGVAVMKTLAGAKGQNLKAFRRYWTTYRQAALKWVLTNPDISTAVISISTRQQVDEFAAASGNPLTLEDQRILEKYVALFSDQYCRLCNECEPACPYQIPMADILRHSMYTYDYGQMERGREYYATLERNASLCTGCAAPCLSACRYGVAIKREMIKAHRGMG